MLVNMQQKGILMRAYEEIYDLFIDLIKGNIDEVKVTFAELKMLDKKILINLENQVIKNENK